LKESYGKIYQRIKNNLETVAKDGVTLQEIIDKVENIRTLLWEESGKKEVKKKKGEKPRWALLHPKFDIKSLIELFKDKNDPVLKKIVFALQEEKRIIRAAMKDGTVGDYRDRVKGFISPKQENLEENDGSEKPEPIKESKKEPETPKEETPPRKK
jgi:hypothetical protein